MKHTGWWLMGLAGIFSFFCGSATAMNKQTEPVTHFK